jgi:hypothetical protein
MKLFRGATLVFLALLLLWAPAAGAAQRYVAAGGAEGEVCTQQKPCSLKVGVGGAKSNDEVILAAGTYQVEGAVYSPEAAENVWVHGDLTGPMPRIAGKVGSSAPLYTAGPGGRLSYLDISNESSLAFGAFCSGSIDRVRVHVASANAVGVNQTSNCPVRDSLVIAEGEAATAIRAGSVSGDTSPVIRNVTAIATGPGSIGVVSLFMLNPFIPGATPGTTTVDLKNAIVSGAKTDLEARTELTATSTAKLVVANSNFDSTANGTNGTVIDGGANQSAPPAFVNAAAGDYREAAGSPTIDAGAADPLLGPLDLEGNPRVLGAGVDIGAFELVPPAAMGPAAAAIKSLAISPRAFKPANFGAAVVSVGKKSRVPVTATVAYALSAPAAVQFSVERKLPGRRVKGKCVRRTRANRASKPCPRFKRVGSFSHLGAAGENRFKFSGRVNGRPLKPGAYRLVGRTSATSRSAGFRIVQ